MPQLTIPLVLPTAWDPRTKASLPPAAGLSLVHLACSRARPSLVKAWNPSPSSNTARERVGTQRTHTTVAMGCDDGSFFLFHVAEPAHDLGSRSASPPPMSPQKVGSLRTQKRKAATSRSSSPLSPNRRGRSPSPAPSVASMGAPFSMTSRSRIVSGVTLEQAKAPKNFVDFDEEPDKLKGLLKTSGVREKTVMDGILPHFGQHDLPLGNKKERPTTAAVPRLSLMSLPSASKVRTQAAPDIMHAPSPAMSTNTLSPPPTPTSSMSQSNAMNLQYHTYLHRSGDGCAVRAMERLEDAPQVLILQQNGDLSLCHLEDGVCVASLALADAHSHQQENGMVGMSFKRYYWNHMEVRRASGRTIILATAEESQVEDQLAYLEEKVASSDDRRCRVVIAEMEAATSTANPREYARLRILKAFSADTPFCQGIDLHLDMQGSMNLVFVDASGALSTQMLTVHEDNAGYPIASVNEEERRHISLNPFKALTTHAAEALPLIGEKPALPDARNTALLGEQPANIVGNIALEKPIRGVRLYRVNDEQRGITWTDDGMSMFNYDGTVLKSSAPEKFEGVCDVAWINDVTFVAQYVAHADVYRLVGENHLDSAKTYTMKTLRYQVVHFLSANDVIATRVNQKGRRKFDRLMAEPADSASSSPGVHRQLWSAWHEQPAVTPPWENRAESSKTLATVVLPLNLNTIVVGYDDGYIRRSSLLKLCLREEDVFCKTSKAPLDGMVSYLQDVMNPRTGEQMIVGGSDDGCIAFWTSNSLELKARWTLFNSPLIQAKQIRDPIAGKLNDCVFCLSQDGTIAAFAVDGLHFLFMVPGAESPLAEFCVNEAEILLIYEDGLARLWDVKTREFRRSTTSDKASELLAEHAWAEWKIKDKLSVTDSVIRACQTQWSNDSASAILLDIEAVLQQASGGPGKAQAEGVLSILRAILSATLTFGLSDEIDRICKDSLLIPASSALVGVAGVESVSFLACSNARESWGISPIASATRLLSIIAVLRAWMNLGDHVDDANTVLLFYANSISQAVGASFQAPDLAFLAQTWLSSTSKPTLVLDRRGSVDLLSTFEDEVRHAARIAFDSSLARLSDGETIALIDEWQSRLPNLCAPSVAESLIAATALYICGCTAISKFKLLGSDALGNISKSIALYLHNETSEYQSLAIDLTLRGFDVWQHYADPMDLLRVLFTIATSTKKASISTHNVGTQARLAVVSIASTHTPLFMSTLSLEILQPQSIQDRKAVMQLVAFLIRKKPAVIYQSLPRLIEAVVKSLDPSSTGNREAVHDAATEILGHVVQTFPTVDFHSASQRLAVGTTEGAVIMYDLKTATRLYVLEAHRRRATGCSFSPDGRRLVTVSIEESVALVWKVGPSLSSFFNPGAPPRQGRGGSEPFKTLPFNVGEEAEMTLAATLEDIRFEWSSDRNVRLKIRESTLSFST